MNVKKRFFTQSRKGAKFLVQVFFVLLGGQSFAASTTTTEYFGLGKYEDGDRAWYARMYDGSVEATFNDAGENQSASRYSAFGQRISEVGDVVNREAFQGHDLDEELGHYNRGVRNTTTEGTWLQPEPLVVAGNPLVGSPYRYAANNPPNFTDPSGWAPLPQGVTEEMLINDYNNGMSFREVAAKNGMDLTSVYKLIGSKVEVRGSTGRTTLPEGVNVDMVAQEYREGMSFDQLGEKYGCTGKTIKTMLGDRVAARTPKEFRPIPEGVTPEILAQEYAQGGTTYRALGQKYGISGGTVYKMISGKTYGSPKGGGRGGNAAMIGLMFVENTGWYACMEQSISGEPPDPDAWYATDAAMELWYSRSAACETYIEEQAQRPTSTPALGSITHYAY